MPNSDRTATVRCRRRARRKAIYGVIALLFAVLQVSFSAPMLAHEGHDHDKPAPLNLPIAPRLLAVTPDYELVAVLSGEQRLTIFLHRFATNEPVKSAKLTVAVGEHEAEATAKEDGVFEIAAPWISGTAPIDVVFKLALPDDQDILTGRLERTAVSGAAAVEPSPGWQQYQAMLYAAASALMAGVLLTLLVVAALARRRQSRAEIDLSTRDRAEPTEAKVKPLRRALLALLAVLLAAAMAPDQGLAQPASLPSVPSTMATDQPQRMADGTLFVPKATQHLLSVRTILTAETQAPRTVELVGTVIPDPNHFGASSRHGLAGSRFPRAVSPMSASRSRRASCWATWCRTSKLPTRPTSKARSRRPRPGSSSSLPSCPATTSGPAPCRRSRWTRSRASSMRSGESAPS